jgi:hypothetical protein
LQISLLVVASNEGGRERRADWLAQDGQSTTVGGGNRRHAPLGHKSRPEIIPEDMTPNGRRCQIVLSLLNTLAASSCLPKRINQSFESSTLVSRTRIRELTKMKLKGLSNQSKSDRPNQEHTSARRPGLLVRLKVAVDLSSPLSSARILAGASRNRAGQLLASC